MQPHREFEHMHVTSLAAVTSITYRWQDGLQSTSRSISYASTLGLPVYITENGIPAAADDPNRAKWINGCLDVVRFCVWLPRLPSIISLIICSRILVIISSKMRGTGMSPAVSVSGIIVWLISLYCRELHLRISPLVNISNKWVGRMLTATCAGPHRWRPQ